MPYALSVLNALYRRLIEQRYLLANPFAGVKVRVGRRATLDTACAFTEGEWSEWKLVRVVADGLEWPYGWGEAAAPRLRFALDFAYSTALRVSDLVGAKLRAIEREPSGNAWIRWSARATRPDVVLPPLARRALDRYFVERRLPVTPSKWRPSTPLVGSLGDEGGITAWRLWRVMKRFFATAAAVVEDSSPALAEKLRRATLHWMTTASAKLAGLSTVHACLACRVRQTAHSLRTSSRYPSRSAHARLRPSSALDSLRSFVIGSKPCRLRDGPVVRRAPTS